MLNILREKAEAARIADRCDFHEGYLDSLAASAPFDAATSVLVSHFILDPKAREAYFREIAHRLKPGAPLLSADLACAVEGEPREMLYREWQRLQGGPFAAATAYADALWKGAVAISKPCEIEAIIKGGGFSEVAPIYQALFIHGWLARR